MDTLITPNRLTGTSTRIDTSARTRPEPQTQPTVQPSGERLVVSIPRNWSRHYPDGSLAASSPAREVSLRVRTDRYYADLNINLSEFAKYHYSFALESFVRFGVERRFSNHALDIVVQDFVHPLYGLNRVIGCVQVKELTNTFVRLQFSSKVSSIDEYRQKIDGIITSIKVERFT